MEEGRKVGREKGGRGEKGGGGRGKGREEREGREWKGAEGGRCAATGWQVCFYYHMTRICLKGEFPLTQECDKLLWLGASVLFIVWLWNRLIRSAIRCGYIGQKYWYCY